MCNTAGRPEFPIATVVVAWSDLTISSSIGATQVQMAGRTAGAAATHSAASRDAIQMVPFSAWDLDAHRGGASVDRARFGGFVGGTDLFDAAAFGITPAEAELMDPQQRALMEVCCASAVLDARTRPLGSDRALAGGPHEAARELVSASIILHLPLEPTEHVPGNCAPLLS